MIRSGYRTRWLLSICPFCLLVALLLAGCGRGGGGPTQAIGGGQTTITGQVVDATDVATPVADAYVYVPLAAPSSRALPPQVISYDRTDAQGRYTLTNVPGGSAAIVVEPPEGSNFNPIQFAVRAPDAGEVDIRVTLLPTTVSVASVIVDPTSATLSVGDEQSFTATVLDTQEREMQVTPTWAVVGGNIGTVNENGLFTATTAGTGHVVAIVGEQYGQASVTVESAIPAEAVGTWQYARATVDGNPVPVATVHNWSTDTVREIMTLNANGTIRSEEQDAQGGVNFWVEGTISFVGNDFTWTSTDSSDPAAVGETGTGTYALSGDVLTLTTVEDSHTVLYTLYRVVSGRPEAPILPCGWVSDPASPNQVELICKASAGATAFNLYSSSDGNNFTKVAQITSDQLFHIWADFRQTVSSLTYFYITAENTAGESPPSQLIFADPSRVAWGGVTGLTPSEGQTNVSTTPTLSWTAVPGAVAYGIGVDDKVLDHTVYTVGVSSSVTSIPYGQTSGPGVLAGWAEVSSLSPGRAHWWEVHAIDATNWAFAYSNHVNFTTAGL